MLQESKKKYEDEPKFNKKSANAALELVSCTVLKFTRIFISFINKKYYVSKRMA